MSRCHIFGPTLLALVVFAAPIEADNSRQVQQSIDRGVKYLKSVEFGFEVHAVGKAALVGLTLLECGMPADDPAVERAAATVRDASVSLTHTYSVSLAIMFLDRLGDPGDVPLLQSLGVRLAGGQNMAGGWGYECPDVEEEEVRRLTNLQRQRRELRGQEKPPPAVRGERPKLPNALSDYLARLEQRRLPQNMADAVRRDDNSNTQFAILGLWIARRHGVPVEKSLALVEQRFRKSQNADGGWGYHTRSHSTPSMTCAGLLGLAMVYGNANEAVLRTAEAGNAKPGTKPPTPRNPGRDPAVIAGLKCISHGIGQPLSRGGAPVRGIPHGEGRRLYYYLWSLERVAVAYDLKTIGKKDWYAWGSELLVASQEEDGSWTGEFGGAVDTSFALLFLRRANLATDLTASLKGRVKDPGEVTLKAGGVGGEALQKPDSTTGSETPTARPADAVPGTPKDAGTETDAVRLRTELVNAPAERRAAMLEVYKNAKGIAYTDALATAIPKLPANSQSKARDALAERLMRMNTATLRERMRDTDAEMRVAAARAVAGKDDLTHVPDLITLLDDREAIVVRSARSALKHLARGKDFGPADETNVKERARAVEEWKKWWNDQRPR